ncbi:MAG: MMPL family transporter, partial [Patescibacteria group bacterium]
IAGFILSIGMAVDANILIFERTKEEMKRGKTKSEALKEGFHRAWSSIRDSNLSSIITAVILYYLASTPVIKGFALVFLIGVLVSMFSAITASRTILFAITTSPPTPLLVKERGEKRR